MKIEPKIVKGAYIKELARFKRDGKEYSRNLYIDIEQRESHPPNLYVSVSIPNLNEHRFAGTYEEWPLVNSAVLEAIDDFEKYRFDK